MSRTLGGVALAATVTVVGVAGLMGVSGPATKAPAKLPPKGVTSGLARFDSCSALRNYAVGRSLSMMNRYGIGSYPVQWVAGGPMFREAMPTAPAPRGAVPTTAVPDMQAAPASAAPGGVTGTQGVDYSGTNLQEAGVDEPDIVVSDAQHIITTANDELRIFSAGDTPQSVGTLAIRNLGADAQLLWVGDRVLVISSESPVYAYARPGMAVEAPPTATVRAVSPSREYIPQQPRTVVRMVDVSDMAHPRLVETLKIDGRLVGARRPANGAVRLVVHATPDAIPMYGAGSPQATTQAQANALNRRTIRRAHPATWLPAMQIQEAGKKAVRRTAVGCRDVARATQFAGLDAMTVLTIDPAKGLEPVDRDAVMTDGEIIYGSADSLYITTPRWSNPSTSSVPTGGRTQIHRFDISVPDATGYSASGDVPGYVLNQFSMSEQAGVLRVASTVQPTWAGDETTPSESYVTTLAQDGRRLVTKGQVGGLGKTERIYGVRFVGDLGYVVTFRQTDPLYVVDLTDPAAPRVRGQLKIPGYSAYLHPVGPGLLLGVGQNATDQGRTTGTQISLFDVSNPDRPTRIQNLTLDEGWSEAENDHHAFLYWAPTGLAMIPVSTYSPQGTLSQAVGVRVSNQAITRVRAFSQPGADGMLPTIRRSMVVGDRVFTVSDQGVQANRLSDLITLGYTPYK